MSYAHIEDALKQQGLQETRDNIHTADDVNQKLLFTAFTTGFIFNICQTWKEFLENSILGFIGFPLVVVLEGLAFIFSCLEYKKAKNKNLGKLSNILLKAMKFLLVATAVSIAIAAKFATLASASLLVPTLFTSAITCNFLYNTVAAIRALIHMYKAPKNSAVYEANKRRAKISGFHAVITMLLAASLITLMIVPLFTFVSPLLIATAAIVAASTCLITLIYSIYRTFKLYSSKHVAQQSTIAMQSHSVANNLLQSKEHKSLLNPKNNPHQQQNNPAHCDIKTKKAIGDQTDYYYRKGRLLFVEKNDGESNQYLINEIDLKIKEIKKQMQHDNTIGSWLASKTQSKKHLAKIEALEFLKRHLLKQDEKIRENIIARGSIKEYYWENHSEATKAFLSWKKDISDVEDIFDAVDKYFFGDTHTKQAYSNYG